MFSTLELLGFYWSFLRFCVCLSGIWESQGQTSGQSCSQLPGIRPHTLTHMSYPPHTPCPETQNQEPGSGAPHLCAPEPPGPPERPVPPSALDPVGASPRGPHAVPGPPRGQISHQSFSGITSLCCHAGSAHTFCAISFLPVMFGGSRHSRPEDICNILALLVHEEVYCTAVLICMTNVVEYLFIC